MSEREVLKHKNGCDLYEVTIGVDRVVIDHYCNGVHDDILSFDRIDCAWFAPILAEFAAPTPQPITADWLRESGWNPVDDVPTLRFGDGRRIELWGWNEFETDGGDLFYSNGGSPAFFVRRVHTTADLANLVAALRGGEK